MEVLHFLVLLSIVLTVGNIVARKYFKDESKPKKKSFFETIEENS